MDCQAANAGGFYICAQPCLEMTGCCNFAIRTGVSIQGAFGSAS